MRRLFSLTVALVFLFCCAGTVSAWEDIDPIDAADMLESNPNAYILDVRTVCEYKFVGHCDVPDGKIKNIPFWKFEFDWSCHEYIYYAGGVANENRFFDEAVYRNFDPATDTLIVVCRSGGRASRAATDLEDPSEPAANRMEQLGFFNMYVMEGGFSFGWEPAGLPVSTGYEGIWKPSDFAGRSLGHASLGPAHNSGVSGKAKLVTKEDGTTKVVLKKFKGLTPGRTYQASVRSGSCDGDILFLLNDVIVDAQGVGKSVTVVDARIDYATWCIEVQGLTCGKVEFSQP